MSVSRCSERGGGAGQQPTGGFACYAFQNAQDREIGLLEDQGVRVAAVTRPPPDCSSG